MDIDRAKELLAGERRRLEGLLAEAPDDAVLNALGTRLAAVNRAEERLERGTYGRSLQSGAPIPDARLEANPAAELTLEEQEAEE